MVAQKKAPPKRKAAAKTKIQSTPKSPSPSELMADAAIDIASIPSDLANLPAPTEPGKRKRSWWERPIVNKKIMQSGRVSETDEHREAFNEYLAMGDNRSINKLAEKLGRNPAVVGRWSIKYKWTERIIEWGQQDGMARTIQSLDQEVSSKKLAVSICNKIIENSAIFDEEGNFKDTTIIARSVADLQRVFEAKNAILYGANSKPDAGKSATQIGQAVFIIKK